MWLRDFLPADVPEARILTFGYDAALFGRSVLNLVDVANNLIAGILSVRDEQVLVHAIFGPAPGQLNDEGAEPDKTFGLCWP